MDWTVSKSALGLSDDKQWEGSSLKDHGKATRHWKCTRLCYEIHWNITSLHKEKLIFTFLGPYGRKTRSQHARSRRKLKDLVLACTITNILFLPGIQEKKRSWWQCLSFSTGQPQPSCSWCHRSLFSTFIILLLKRPDQALSTPTCFLDREFWTFFHEKTNRIRS